MRGVSRLPRHGRPAPRRSRMLPLAWLLSLTAFSPSTGWAEAAQQKRAIGATVAREIGWDELAPPDQTLTVDEMIGDVDHFGDSVHPVHNDARAVSAMNGVTGTLSGYLVPIATDSQRRIVELFLVPYYGACIHVPPPPANQIIHIRPDQPLPAGELWYAYRVTGTLRIAKTANKTATAIYAMDLKSLEPIADSENRRYSWLIDGIIIVIFLVLLFAAKAIARWHPPTRAGP